MSELRDELKSMVDLQWRPGAEWLERIGRQKEADVLRQCAADVLNLLADSIHVTIQGTDMTGKELVDRFTKEMSRQARATGSNPLDSPGDDE